MKIRKNISDFFIVFIVNKIYNVHKVRNDNYEQNKYY